MTKLYELTTELRQLSDFVDEHETHECMELIEMHLENLKWAIEEKATNIGALVQNWDAQAKAIKEAEERMAARRKAIENRIKRLKEYLLTNMQLSGITKVECPYFVLSIRNNPPRVAIDDETLIPEKYFSQPAPELSKQTILQDLKNGVEIPGARLEQGQSLSIR